MTLNGTEPFFDPGAAPASRFRGASGRSSFILVVSRSLACFRVHPRLALPFPVNMTPALVSSQSGGFRLFLQERQPGCLNLSYGKIHRSGRLFQRRGHECAALPELKLPGRDAFLPEP